MIFRRSLTEEHAGEDWPKKPRSAPSGAVQDEDGIGGVSAGVFHRLAERGVVHADFGEGFAGLEMEVVDYEIAFVPIGQYRRRAQFRLNCGQVENEHIQTRHFPPRQRSVIDPERREQ